MNNRLSKLRQILARNEVDAMLITQAENRRYLSGFDGTSGYLLITAGKAVLATDFRYTEQAAAEARDFEIVKITSKLDDWFPGLVRDFGIRRLAFEATDVSFELHRQLNDSLESKKIGTELVAVTGLVESLRSVKEAAEIELIRRAAAITDTAFETVIGHLRPGTTEIELAWKLEKAMRENGSQALPFDVIVASGPRAAMPHARPTDRTIREGEPVVIDVGARYGGYAADLTRTICLGRPEETLQKVYRTVLDAQMAAMSIIVAGMTGQQADRAARDIIEKAGFGDAFGHSLGHGVGLAAHEIPRLGPGAENRLTEGMVFTVEPGIYLPGWGGVRIEDTVVLENGGVVPLTRSGKQDMAS